MSTGAAAYWSDAVHNASGTSVAQYYADNSFGTISISPVAHTQPGSPAGVVTVSLAQNHPNCLEGSCSYSTESAWINSALAAAAPNVNFSALDTNGDGTITVDEALIYFILAGYETSAGSGLTPSYWAHAWGGFGVSVSGKNVNHWALNGERYNASTLMQMGVIAHEMGHAMGGLPDLYDTSLYNEGLGFFSLMAGGSWGGRSGEISGATPVGFDAWSRQYLGWSNPQFPANGATISFASALSGPAASIMLMNSAISTSEYWLVENRPPVGWDAGMYRNLGSWTGGLLIQHIDLNVGSKSANSFNKYVSGAHQGNMAVEPSTATCSLKAATTASNSSSGCPTILYYSGNSTTFNGGSNPNSNYYSGAASGLGVTGISAPGSTMTATVQTVISGTVPSAPTIGTATAGNAQATVSFTAPTNNGGSAITSYMVTSSPGGITKTGTASPITVTGLTNGTSYTFTVTATNSVGTGPASAPSNSVTPSAAVTPPSAPTLTGATASDTNATLSFTAPTSTGGSPITGYTGTCTAAGKTPGTGTGTSSPILVSGLAIGTTYSCTLTATNSAGTSAASNALTVTTLTATCTYSLSPTSQALGAASANGSIAVTAAAGCAWTAASNATWISITSGSSGSGNGTVIYSAAANSTGSSRTGTLTIAGNTFTVTQGTSALSTIRNALFINASTSGNKTSVLRLINTSNQSGAITATVYDEAGSTVGTSNVVIGTPAARQMLSFTSAQLEAAIGYTASSSTAKYRIVFAGNLSGFEVINFIKDVASGNLTLGQAQVDNRAASSATTSTRNALFVNASTSPNKTTVLRLINLSSSNGSITATAYDEAGNPIGVSNASIGIVAAQQMLSLTSAQLEAAIGFTPASTTAKYRIVFSANLNSFEVLNFIKDVATGSLTLGQEQID